MSVAAFAARAALAAATVVVAALVLADQLAGLLDVFIGGLLAVCTAATLLDGRPRQVRR